MALQAFANFLSLSGEKRKQSWLADPREHCSAGPSCDSKRFRHDESDHATTDAMPLTLDSLMALDALCILGEEPPARASGAESPFPVGTAQDMESRFRRTSRVLGSGQFGSVAVCQDRVTGEDVACKTLRKNATGAAVPGGPALPSKIQEVRREAEFMARLAGHEGVVQVRGLYDSGDEVHLMMELCEGGDLFDELTCRGQFSERSTADVFSQLVSAVAFCHSRGVLHRDLKPENVLLTRGSASEAGKTPRVKLADFGLAAEIKEGELLTGMAGSPYYMAPEVLSGQYDKTADVWSLGVILYILLSGSPPFWGETDGEVFEAIRDGYVDFSFDTWDSVSTQAKSLVKALLSQDPHDRPSLERVLAHPWIQAHVERSSNCASEDASDVLDNMMAQAFGSILA